MCRSNWTIDQVSKINNKTNISIKQWLNIYFFHILYCIILFSSGESIHLKNLLATEMQKNNEYVERALYDAKQSEMEMEQKVKEIQKLQRYVK